MWVTGNYSLWWAQFTTGKSASQLKGNADLDGVLNPVEWFNYVSSLALSFLSVPLLGSILVLGVSTPNTFARLTKDWTGDGHQYRTIMRTLNIWIRLVTVGVILTLIVGLCFFYLTIEAMVYLKFTDSIISVDSTPFSLFANPKSTYGWSGTSLRWFCFFPLGIAACLMSAGVYSMNQYPGRPVTDLILPINKKKQLRRLLLHDKLTYFLATHCHLPLLTSNPEKVKIGSPTTCIPGRGRGHERGVYHSGAGGYGSSEAEVVADLLIDNGCHEVEILLKAILPISLGGAGKGDFLQKIDGMHIMAAVLVRAGILDVAEECKRKGLLKACNVTESYGFEESDVQRKTHKKREAIGIVDGATNIKAIHDFCMEEPYIRDPLDRASEIESMDQCDQAKAILTFSEIMSQRQAKEYKRHVVEAI
eukprot:m.6711 g.6711  ORF g.6711 m.6711 type:complete len:420 (-) comp5151_c0_seq1:51-1310(-)